MKAKVGMVVKAALVRRSWRAWRCGDDNSGTRVAVAVASCGLYDGVAAAVGGVVAAAAAAVNGGDDVVGLVVGWCWSSKWCLMAGGVRWWPKVGRSWWEAPENEKRWGLGLYPKMREP
ncbi:hypothetical protein Tco_0432691 [Tanacetum coccineum]